MLMLVQERLHVVVPQHNSHPILHEPPLRPFPPHAFPLFSSCLSQYKPLQHYNTTQKTKKGRTGWGRFLQRYSTTVFIALNECGWLGERCFSHLTLFLFLLYFCQVLFVSTSPWHFHCFCLLVFCFVLFFFYIWIYIYCLDCCWTSLWYQNERKLTKKTPSVLKYCIAIVFNAKYYL